MVIQIPKPILIASLIGSTYGGAVLLKDYIGGEPYKKIVDASDKVVIVTGANSGIGKATAFEFAFLKAKVILACRDIEKCETARENIVMATRNRHVYCRKCDLASQVSIRKFVGRILKEFEKVNILINNAGVMECPKDNTIEGIEMHLGVNYMGHFLLTNLLLDKLKESAPSRIVMLSDYSYTKGNINVDDINSEIKYQPVEAYRQSKLANMMFVRELNNRLLGTNVTINAVNPGSVSSEIYRHTSFARSGWSYIYLPFMWPLIKTPEQAAKAVLFVALDPSLKNVSGKCFKYQKEEEIADNAKDEKISKWLWIVSEKWTHL